MSRSLPSPLTSFAALALATTVCGCDPIQPFPDEPEIEFVTISGVVRNVDTGFFALNARVRLWGTDYMDDIATGTDGAFSLRVPKGSRVLLHTDDFDATSGDVWFPLINVEYPPIFADGDIDDLPIHTCPNTTAPQLGSVAAWDNYLQNADAANGDMFEPMYSRDAGGILSLLFFGCVEGGDELALMPNLRLRPDDAAFLEGYIDPLRIFGSAGSPDPSLGPEIMYPPGTTSSPIHTWFMSWAPSTYTGSWVTVTIEDLDTSRNMQWFSPIEIPVASGTISLMLPSFIDDQPNKSFEEAAHCLGLF